MFLDAMMPYRRTSAASMLYNSRTPSSRLAAT
jgi:hypothetical protein